MQTSGKKYNVNNNSVEKAWISKHLITFNKIQNQIYDDGIRRHIITESLKTTKYWTI